MSSSPANTIDLSPRQGRADRLFILLHGVGASAAGLLPLASLIQGHFPTAAVEIPDGLFPFDLGATGRQWFSVRGVTEQNRPERVAKSLPLLEALIKDAQQRHDIPAANTVLVGFSQGSIMALELAMAHDGLVGGVVAFAGRFAALPNQAPKFTRIHLLHGEHDAVMPVALAHAAFERLHASKASVTLDTEAGVGHELTESLVSKALERLHTLNWQSR